MWPKYVETLCGQNMYLIQRLNEKMHCVQNPTESLMIWVFLIKLYIDVKETDI